MAIDKNDLARQYAARKARNLAYFQKAHPALYKRFSAYTMRRVEVAISPVEADIDLIREGVSLYQGKASAVCQQEVDGFLAHYRKLGKLKSLNPPWDTTFGSNWFAESALRASVEKSPLTPDAFSGYTLGKQLFPQLVFLGCGAGFHIQALLEKVHAVNAVVFEPDPELFAASLFCVDWESVGKRFNPAKGESLVFLIGGDEPMSLEGQKSALENHLHPTAPMYPYMTVFINHRKDPAMAKVIKEFGLGIHKFRTSWLDYDDTLRRARNSIHNLAASPRVLSSAPLEAAFPNVVIVGSGPSIDQRFSELRTHRDQYLLVSAGTGIKGLLDNDLIPDYHVELDPDYLVYGYLSQLEQSRLKKTVLIAVNEVNPLVTSLFDRTLLYFKTENPTTMLFGQHANSFEFCNPTVTNAALSVFGQLGARQIFLFGCDLGYRDFQRHHSKASIYELDSDEVSARLKKRAELRSREKSSFKVAGVDGGEVFTRSDFFVAKQEMEILIRQRPGAVSGFFNCSDGAAIDGTQWLNSEAFVNQLSQAGKDGVWPSLYDHGARFDGRKASHLASALVEGIQEHMQRMNGALRTFALEGHRDLARAIQFMAKQNMTVALRSGHQRPTVEQIYGQYVVGGAIRSFLMIALAHGMALEDRHQLRDFLAGWSDDFRRFLTEVPDHSRSVLLNDDAPADDPWVTTTMKWIRPDDSVEGAQPSVV